MRIGSVSPRAQLRNDRLSGRVPASLGSTTTKKKAGAKHPANPVGNRVDRPSGVTDVQILKIPQIQSLTLFPKTEIATVLPGL